MGLELARRAALHALVVTGALSLGWATASAGCAAGSDTSSDGAGGAGADGGMGGEIGGAAGEAGQAGGQAGEGGGTAGAGGAAPFCGDGAVDAPEECDGASNATCADFGWDGGAIPCTAACTHDVLVCDGCGNGIIEPVLDEQCDFDMQGDPLVLATCASLGFLSSGANPDCNPANCQYDTKICECGDGVADPGEICDGADLAGHTCPTEGFTDGVLVCTPDCDLDTSGCTTCGNGVVEGAEACDMGDLGGHTCQTEGYTAGTLSCTTGCTLDESDCTTCGNGALEMGEQCDDGNTVSGDGCSSTCTTEVVMCDPDGVYLVQGSPLTYSCCSGLVSVNVSSFILAANGASIQSSPSSPVTMTGAATSCPSGSFSNAGSIPGGCSEGYAVAGTFTGADTWTGLYTVTFSGPDCDCFGGLLGTPCVNQVFPVTAQR
jgi:cysteine-rich repeat protein